jgi:hypothetical protein
MVSTTAWTISSGSVATMSVLIAPGITQLNHRIIASLMPRATLHTVRGGGHLVLLDSAQKVGPVISSFLQDDRSARNAAEA